MKLSVFSGMFKGLPLKTAMASVSAIVTTALSSRRDTARTTST